MSNLGNVRAGVCEENVVVCGRVCVDVCLDERSCIHQLGAFVLHTACPCVMHSAYRQDNVRINPH